MVKQIVSFGMKLSCAVFVSCELQFCVRMRVKKWNY